MKQWLLEFGNDLRHIWREFIKEINEKDANSSNYQEDDYGDSKKASWHAKPDLDMRKAVNNIDIFHKEDMHSSGFGGFHRTHRD
ncbi:hypothetical protein ACNJ8R_004123 [Cronobacter sakazakii]|uniref:hypothetical protein n=1 Tax=Cronobacter sakazakii TaxID=28141 RepID=UPI0009B98CC0|nr:hypothetical protein [Cronobacter sakazakii]EJL7720642.1 hypothetical protein [Cronobacter sakazakii]EJV9557815.1 hypothetical protein [Cronobacter sakazakii]EJV9561870.1 hypothetical protein [Cronobacter sakazakii]EJX1223064.1 hypothetical protein [Cronobacter sakazakii]EJX4594387.1 hypothetical protein [Cronobacter sakazakii]